MSQKKFALTPLFDGLQSMLKGENYQPKLNKAFQQDYDHAKNFLLSYRGSVDTFNSYRRDIERFLQWCFFKANKTVKKIKRTEFEDFLSFCQNPPISWIATTVEDRFIEKDGEKSLLQNYLKNKQPYYICYFKVIKIRLVVPMFIF